MEINKLYLDYGAAMVLLTNSVVTYMVEKELGSLHPRIFRMLGLTIPQWAYRVYGWQVNLCLLALVLINIIRDSVYN